MFAKQNRSGVLKMNGVVFKPYSEMVRNLIFQWHVKRFEVLANRNCHKITTPKLDGSI